MLPVTMAPCSTSQHGIKSTVASGKLLDTKQKQISQGILFFIETKPNRFAFIILIFQGKLLYVFLPN